MNRIVALFFLLQSISCISQDQLPRRNFFGIQTQPLSEERSRDLQVGGGVDIVAIVPNSTASQAGVMRGDVLIAINNSVVQNHASVTNISKTIKAGATVRWEVIRKGKKISLKSAMKQFPMESYKDLNVAYNHITVGGTKLRTIVTAPKNANNSKAVLYIQGISCASIDNPLDTSSTQTQFINHLARRGFVVMRVDKQGTGDSEGVPCSDLDFTTEASGYEAALKALHEHPAINKQNIYIFGHSMGGVWAPIISKEIPVKGIAVYGAIGTNYLEYIINSRRTVATAINLNPEEAADYVQGYAECMGLYVGMNYDAQKVLNVNPDCANELQLTAIRSQEFQKQLAALNIPSLWKSVDEPVLAMWGSSDFVSLRSDHEHIANAVNYYHNGNGNFAEVAYADHGMSSANTFQQAITNPGAFNDEVVRVFTDWVNGKKTAVKSQIEAVNFPNDPTVKEILRMPFIENAYPRWGNNNKIIFQTNRDGHWQIYAMNEDGTDQQNLSNDKFNNNFVSTSADGRLIGFVSDRDGNEEIYVMNVDGTNVRRLTNSPGRDIHPYFTPDGKRVFFNSTRDDRSNFDVYSMDLNGGNIERLTNTVDDETCARLSPDGKSMILLAGMQSIMNDEVQILNPNGTNTRNITKSDAAEGWPTWSADGKKVYYASNPDGTFCIYEMNPDGSAKRQLTSVKAPFMDARPEISPDGKKMLFNRQVTERNGKNTIAIYIRQLS